MRLQIFSNVILQEKTKTTHKQMVQIPTHKNDLANNKKTKKNPQIASIHSMNRQQNRRTDRRRVQIHKIEMHPSKPPTHPPKHPSTHID